jgi:hypothetical protein
MKNKMKYIVIAVLILVVCSAGVVANNYWYRTTPCNAIDISLTDARVITFLDTTNMATPTVYKCNYKCNYNGYNTWLVNWHTQTQSQRVYVDIVTGQIVETGPKPGPCWHTVETFQGRYDRVTPIFTIKGDTWRMNWETVGRENESLISVAVYKDLLFPTFVDGFSGNNYPFSDTYCVYEGAGTYNLGILAHELEYYSITVEDFY